MEQKLLFGLIGVIALAGVGVGGYLFGTHHQTTTTEASKASSESTVSSSSIPSSSAPTTTTSSVSTQLGSLGRRSRHT